MPRPLKGMVKRKDRPGWYLRTFRNGGEKWVKLDDDYGEAVKKLRLYQGGTPIPTSHGLTVREALERWLTEYVPFRRTGKGPLLAQQRVRDFLEPALGGIPVDRLTKQDAWALRSWLEKKTKLSLQSVFHVLSDYRCFVNWMLEGELVSRSLFPKRVMPRLQEVPPKRLTDEEVAALVNLPEPYGFVARLGIGTGLRWGEMVRLQSTDVQDGALVVHHTKGRRVRRVFLSPELLAELRFRVGRIMPLEDGTGFTRQVVRLTGLKDFHPHRMRHTFAARWAESGGSLAALKEMLGHVDISTTMRYARISDDMVRREAERVARTAWNR